MKSSPPRAANTKQILKLTKKTSEYVIPLPCGLNHLQLRHAHTALELINSATTGSNGVGYFNASDVFQHSFTVNWTSKTPRDILHWSLYIEVLQTHFWWFGKIVKGMQATWVMRPNALQDLHTNNQALTLRFSTNTPWMNTEEFRSIRRYSSRGSKMETMSVCNYLESKLKETGYYVPWGTDHG